MKKIIPFLMLAVLCCGMISCNEKPAKDKEKDSGDVELISYKIVKNLADGSQVTDKIEAKNDTDAVRKFIDLMTKDVVADSEKDSTTIKSMYIISPKGDTLNTNDQLIMNAVEPSSNSKMIQAKKVPIAASPIKNDH